MNDVRYLGQDFNNKLYWCFTLFPHRFNFLKICDLIFIVPPYREKFDYLHAQNYNL